MVPVRSWTCLTRRPASVQLTPRGRYAFEQQPPIGQWNLTRLAEALLPLIDEDEEKAVEIMTKAVNEYRDLYEDAWLTRRRCQNRTI